MKVTAKDVAYVADLANLELSGEERAGMLRDLNSILSHIERLSHLEPSADEPTANLVESYGAAPSEQRREAFADAGREDIPEGLRRSLSSELALQNAPDSDGVFFRVPKVIER